LPEYWPKSKPEPPSRFFGGMSLLLDWIVRIDDNDGSHGANGRICSFCSTTQGLDGNPVYLLDEFQCDRFELFQDGGGLRVAPDVRDPYAETHRLLDRLLLPRVMQHTRGSLQQAALLLGIARQTLRLKFRDLGLSATRTDDAEEDDAV
jgi:hypothetical protein